VNYYLIINNKGQEKHYGFLIKNVVVFCPKILQAQIRYELNGSVGLEAPRPAVQLANATHSVATRGSGFSFTQGK
jgi:hypothetical protein